MTAPEPKPPPKKRGRPKGSGLKKGRTVAGAAIVVASRQARSAPPPGQSGSPPPEVEGEFIPPGRPVGTPGGPPSSEDRARAILERVRHAGGRPLELTRDVITRTVTAILNGASPKNALKAQHFDASTYLDWRRRAKEDLAKDPPVMSIFVEFSLSIDAAVGELGQEAAEWLYANRNTPGGKLSASNVTFLLDRRYADEYGRKQAVELTGKDGGPVKTETHDAREAVFTAACAELGPGLTSAFLVENQRWPESVEEAREWRDRRQPKPPATAETPTP